MSHFSVLVALDCKLEEVAVAEAIEIALYPFDESIQMETEWQPFDTRMDLELMKRVGRIDSQANLQVVSEIAYGAEVTWSGTQWQYATHWNPHGKWDWWQWGGRWAGFIPVKSGAPHLHGERSWCNDKEATPVGRADACMIKDVDLEGELAAARLEAQMAFDRATAAVEGLDPCTPWRERVEKIDVSDREAMEQARRAYLAEPYVAALKATDLFGWNQDPVGIMVDRPAVEDWVKQAETNTFTTFAYVDLAGEWHERGEMFMFGMSEDKHDADEWGQIYQEWLRSLPAETVVAVVDCHV